MLLKIHCVAFVGQSIMEYRRKPSVEQCDKIFGVPHAPFRAQVRVD